MGNKKFTILVCLGFFVLVLFSLASIYIFYTDINNDEIIGEKIKDIQIGTLNIDTEETVKSVFNTDLALKQANLEISITDSNLQSLTEEVVSKYQNYIFHELYLNNYDKVNRYVEEIIEQYNILDNNFRNFQLFLSEVQYFETWDTLSSDVKYNIIKKIKSPNLLLYSYLSLSHNEQQELLIDNNSCIIFEKPIYNINFEYLGDDTASIYSEMNIGESFFIVPDNITGYKINFIVENIEYILYYIMYDNGTIDIVSVKNKGNNDVVTFKYYY